MEKQIQNKTSRWLWRTLKGVPLLILAVVFGAFTTQFIPPIFIGRTQVEFFLLVLAYAGLFSFCFKKRRKLFSAVIVGLLLLSVIVSVSGIGWSPRIIVGNAAKNINFLFNGATFSQVDVLPSNTAVYPHISLQRHIQQKVNFTDSVVRAFSVQYSLLFFDDYYPKYRQICRQFSLMKYIKDNYRYVSDPSHFDYFASPQESISLMAGDCDDYSILMASVMGAIGAKVRIIWAPRHVYPELYCGNKVNFDKYVSAVYTLFEQEIDQKQIYYRIDKNGDYWLNIDYTDNYPGAVYYSNEVLSVIYIK
jgi:hypothetical protein